MSEIPKVYLNTMVRFGVYGNYPKNKSFDPFMLDEMGEFTPEPSGNLAIGSRAKMGNFSILP